MKGVETPSGRRAGLGTEVAAGLIAVGILLRILWLDTLPGINADETCFAVKALQLLRGEGFSWINHGGRLISPFAVGLQIPLHLFFHPSFLILRLPGLVSGVGTLIAAFVVLKRLYGSQAGWWGAVLVASLPEAILHSRITWDPSQIIFLSAVVVYASRTSTVTTAVTAALMAFVGHPTTVFLLPCILAPLLSRAKHLRFDRGTRSGVRAWARVALPSVLILAAGAWLFSFYRVNLGEWGGMANAARLLHPTDAGRFIIGLVDFFSGVTVYEYTTGLMSAWGAWCHRLVFLAAVCLLVALALRNGKKSFVGELKSRTVAFAAGIVLFYLVMGKDGSRFDLDRYRLWMVFPAVEIFVLLILSAANAAAARIVAIAGTVLLLSSYGVNALWIPRTTLSHAYWTSHRSNTVEPKNAAFEFIEKIRPADQDALLIVEDWWIYWPMKYLSMGREGYQVNIYRRPWEPVFPEDFKVSEADLTRKKLIGVAFTGSPYDVTCSLKRDLYPRRQDIMEFPGDHSLFRVYYNIGVRP